MRALNQGAGYHGRPDVFLFPRFVLPSPRRQGQSSQTCARQRTPQPRHCRYNIAKLLRSPLPAHVPVPQVRQLPITSAAVSTPREDAPAEKIWPEPVETDKVIKGSLGHFCQDLLSDWSMVLLGAWVGAKGQQTGLFPLMSLDLFKLLISALCMSLGSRTINDYFDLPCDVINDTSKPLSSGNLSCRACLILSCILFFGAVLSVLTMASQTLQVTVTFIISIAAVYTCWLKQIVGAKNFAIAISQAASLVAGAFATGMATDGLSTIAAPTAYIFCMVLVREIVCDIRDVDGDRATGAWTVPVAFGTHAAVQAATSFAFLAAGMPTWTLISRLNQVQSHLFSMLTCLAGLAALSLIWTEMLALMNYLTCNKMADVAINAQKATVRRAKFLGLAVMVLV